MKLLHGHYAYTAVGTQVQQTGSSTFSWLLVRGNAVVFNATKVRFACLILADGVLPRLGVVLACLNSRAKSVTPCLAQARCG